MEFKDYYATLGVDKTATDAEIKRAYRKLARKYHPDLNPGDKTAEAKFKEINEANEVLGDPEKRKKYDELGANWRMYEQAQRDGGRAPAGQGWSANFGGQRAGGGSYRTMTPEEMQDLFGTDDPFSDFFHTFFGGSSFGDGVGAQGRPRPRRRAQPRPRSRIDRRSHARRGVRRARRARLAMTRDGKERTVDVRIPAGVKDGARVRAAGEGAPGAGRRVGGRPVSHRPHQAALRVSSGAARTSTRASRSR